MLGGIRFLQRKLGYIKRCYEVSRRFRSYEGEGKTSVNILNKETSSVLMIDGYSQYGFRLNNGVMVVGPMAIFPRTVLSWNVGGPSDITEESLCLFYSIEPKIDILVIGIGEKKMDIPFCIRILQFMKKYKINVEILTTEQACATFNFLNTEGRVVAGAMIPPAHIVVSDHDLLQSKLRYQNLYIEK